ncbi:MAG: hypothetical protein ACK5LS_05180 [Propioniciclava sp.]
MGLSPTAANPGAAHHPKTAKSRHTVATAINEQAGIDFAAEMLNRVFKKPP